MRQQHDNETLPRFGPHAVGADLALEQALAIRAEHAAVAAHCAMRVEEARTAGEFAAMRYWMGEYRRATMQCRLLGEQIRRRRTDPPRGSECDVAPPVPPSAVDSPPTGEAA